ncbi:MULTISPECIES: MerR family transcriptional regulator [Actinopolyspora]|uniref:MerR family transcriptional regulator n=1 Tax=Actinopolyspora TaxID=1849 RepID=UPI00158701BC|nr:MULTISPECIES: MerR family DNA-binding transcriptional regulator [Actinopolyspora]
MSDEPVTTGELAKALGLSRRSIARYAEAGQITPEFTTPGGHHRWDVDKVRQQLRDQSPRKR